MTIKNELNKLIRTIKNKCDGPNITDKFFFKYFRIPHLESNEIREVVRYYILSTWRSKEYKYFMMVGKYKILLNSKKKEEVLEALLKLKKQIKHE